MTNFQEIVIDGSEYTIALPNKDTDYIQRKIFEEVTPYEIKMLRDMAHRLSPGELVLDVGANIGNHSLYLAAVAGCKVHAFEPNAALCEAMKTSVTRNKLDAKVIIHCVGVGKQPARAYFGHTDESNLGAQSLTIGENADDTIKIVRLDDLDFNQRVAAIKIDVEGMELAVIEGAADLIKRDHPALYIECQTEKHFSDIHAWISRYGYTYWDTFNATPTHLFVNVAGVTDGQRIDRMVTKVVRNKYQLEQEITNLRSNLNQANSKYRISNEQIASLKEKLKRVLEENGALLARADAASQKYQQVTRQLDTIRRSRVFKVAMYLRRGGRLLTRGVTLPWRLFRLVQRLVGQLFMVATAPSMPEPNQNSRKSPYLMLPEVVIGLKQVPLRDLRVACIMDDFTYHSYQPECDLYPLTPKSWEKELEGCQPHILFIESAWRGKDELWGSKVGHTCKELQRIVRWCQDHNIPTVFWNKEDPVHFETFLNTARLFDFVFTTDIDCIHRYKTALKHDRVYLLPFACQPELNNPIEDFERKDAFCFAGAYYVRYPERTRDLGNFVEHLSVYRSLEIYDRNYGKDNPNYQFPPEYQPHIVGTLPFEQIDKAYKGYRYAINLNSIKQSQTMFARRVYELLASNTVTVSNYSRGVRLLFGDLVVTSDNGGELVRRLETLAGDDLKLRKFRLAALRKVMQEHTYEDRLAYMLAKIKAEPMPDLMPSVLLIAYAENREQLNTLLAHFERQTYANKRLLLVAEEDLGPGESIDDTRVSIVPVKEAAEKAVADYAQGAEWVAGMVAEDYYGPNYLIDLALATRYSEAEVIGKVAHYRWDDATGIETVQLHDEYRLAQQVSGRAVLQRLARMANQPLDIFATGLRDNEVRYIEIQAIDAFNYCENGSTTSADRASIEATVNDMAGLDEGMPLIELLQRAEHIAPEPEVEDEAPLIMGDQLAGYFKASPRKAYRLAVSGKRWEVESSLPDGKHDYLYAARDMTLGELGYEDTAEFYLDVTPGLNVQMVMMFLDKNRQRIHAEVRPANRNQEVPIPEGTGFIRLGLRIYGGGTAAINGLVLGHRRLLPSEVFGRSPYLLLTNHYPSYDDLYRNGFVHSRVKAYQERGVNVDVFRLRKDQPLSYHEFQDVDVITGSQEALHNLLAGGAYRHVLVHFLDADMWSVLKDYIDSIKVTVWVHGSEIQPWHRRDYNFTTEQERDAAKVQSEIRMRFWRSVLDSMPDNLKLIFVSNYFAEEVMEDLGFRLPKSKYGIIHNPIDTDLFSYHTKAASLRKKILSIRPYASRKYANDLSVQAILLLKEKAWFKELEFCMVGDGKLFDDILEPLKGLENVTIKRRFLAQSDIAALHREYGVFLTPTRMDAQGVSRDEAMASGLVPITNAVAAVPEFVDESCGILAPAESAEAMAEGIERLYKDPEAYQMLSENAEKRVRAQSGKEHIINQELAQFVVELDTMHGE